MASCPNPRPADHTPPMARPLRIELAGRLYHVVVETPEANLSKGMRQLNGVYTQRTNRRHGLVGHLFQGRFKAILVQRDAYLLALARYVVLNPVRAGMQEIATFFSVHCSTVSRAV